MDMCRKFLEMGFTRARRYANHKDGKKYNPDRTIKLQEPDALTSDRGMDQDWFICKDIQEYTRFDYKRMMKHIRQ